ncbi:MAG: 3-phosphoshikimate 1-carboxyvinyltransferase [Akkermansia sp.]|nr:3-phosphoshikimate 1-carboxyvinyltransferase [Akkermansia sp.]
MSSDRITVSRAAHGLRGELTVPGDKSISHRVAILGALAAGSMQVQNYLCSEDCLNTLRAMQQLGAQVVIPDASRPQNFTLTGTALAPTAPARDIDCGNSGTGMRLMAGVLAALPFKSKLYGDSSLCSRPMKRIIDPLALMGASLTACGEKPGCAPLAIDGGKLTAIHYDLPMASAQVKSAVLLAGMLTEGTTSVHQPALTRDHTERLFAHFGIPCAVSEDGLTITVQGAVQRITAKDITIPADISSAAFWMVAASIVPGSELLLRHVGLNPTRDAIITVLKRMGADITIVNRTDAGEPYGDILVRTAPLHGTVVEKHEIPNLIDEIPVLAVAAAFAEGVTSIRNAAELRVKESDRIATVVGNLQAMGATVTEYPDGMDITGGTPLHGATMDSYGDHRIAMGFLMAGLAAEGETTLLRCTNINTSYPGFEEHLSSLTK